MVNKNAIALLLLGLIVAGVATFFVYARAERKASVRSGPSSVLVLDDANFDKMVASHKGLMLVDFSASWCNPCRQMAPIVDDFSEEYVGRVHTGKIDVDQSPSTSRRFGVSGIPHLVLMRDGNVVGTKTGLISKEALKEWMDGELK